MNTRESLTLSQTSSLDRKRKHEADNSHDSTEPETKKQRMKEQNRLQARKSRETKKQRAQEQSQLISEQKKTITMLNTLIEMKDADQQLKTIAEQQARLAEANCLIEKHEATVNAQAQRIAELENNCAEYKQTLTKLENENTELLQKQIPEVIYYNPETKFQCQGTKLTLFDTQKTTVIEEKREVALEPVDPFMNELDFGLQDLAWNDYSADKMDF